MRVLLFSSTWMWILFPRLFPYKHAGRQQHTHDDINRLLVEGASTGPGASESGRPFTGQRWFLIWLLNCRTGGNLHIFPVCVCMKKGGVEEAVIIGGERKGNNRMNQLSSVYFLFKVPLNILFYFFKNSGATSHVINSRTFIKKEEDTKTFYCVAQFFIDRPLAFFF